MNDPRSLNRVRAAWAAVGAAIAVTLGAAGFTATTNVSAITTSGERAVYQPITPCRLADFRPAFQVGPRATPIGTDQTLTINARGAQGECTASDLPDDATALVMNVTALDATAPTFLTIWDTGTRPNAASLNPGPGQRPTPNNITTPLSPTGTFNLYNRAGSVNIVIDIAGYYTDHNHDDRYVLADPDTAVVQLAPGFSLDGGWTYNSFGVWEQSASSTSCVIFPIDVPSGRSIAAVDIRYISTGGSVDFAVFSSAIDSTPGTGLTDADIIKRLFSNNFTAPATAVSELGSISVADDPADTLGLPATLATTNMPSGGTATLTVCSDDSVSLVGIVLEFGDPI